MAFSLTIEQIAIPLAALIGLWLGWFLARLTYNKENKRLRASLDASEKEGERHVSENISLSKSLAVAEERIGMYEDLRRQTAEMFQNLSAGALKENNRAFLDLAETTFSRYLETARKDSEYREKSVHHLVEPLKNALGKYEEQIRAMERARENAYGGLTQQVQALGKHQQDLIRETGKLAGAMRVPQVRGRWGEMTLRRVAELAGMQSHCDFFEQQTAQDRDSLLRPDMIVRLPGSRFVVVDAKVPLSAYLDALNAESETDRRARMAAHAKQVQSHIQALSRKAYWRQFTPGPEFVVLFIPGENFFSAALEYLPGLIEDGAGKGVILATPTTTISLLKAVAYGWKQEAAGRHARTISKMGIELYGRLARLADHLNRLGRDLSKTTATYNQVVGTFDKRVFASARRFRDMGVVDTETQPAAFSVSPVDAVSRNSTVTDADAPQQTAAPARTGVSIKKIEEEKQSYEK